MFLAHAHSTITTTSKSFGVSGISIEGLEDYVDNESLSEDPLSDDEYDDAV